METWALPPKLHQYIYKGEKYKALSLLSKISELNIDGLFAEDDESYLRYVSYFRIQLLLEWAHYREALAWACLECELYPDNVDALILKENIKRQVKNLPVPKKHTSRAVAPAKSGLTSDWGKLAGMRELKAVIERDLISPFKNPEESRRYGLKIPQGYLLFGPPGCGKTEVVKQIAKILNFNFMQVDPSSLGSEYIHGTQLKIKALFEEAAKKKPTLLFFDEFEAFVPDRSSLSSHSYQQEVNEFLVQLNTAFEKKILVIAATNFIQRIDPSVIRPGRIDKKIFVGPPDYEARIEAFKIYLKNVPHKVTEWDYLGEETPNLTFAEIKYIVDEAKRKAKAEDKPVDLNHVMKAVVENPAALTEKELRKYLK